MSKTLIALKDWNRIRREYERTYSSGVACPNCPGVELVDTHPEMELLSHPPQMDVHCPQCGFKGYRVS